MATVNHYGSVLIHFPPKRRKKSLAQKLTAFVTYFHYSLVSFLSRLESHENMSTLQYIFLAYHNTIEAV